MTDCGCSRCETSTRLSFSTLPQLQITAPLTSNEYQSFVAGSSVLSPSEAELEASGMLFVLSKIKSATVPPVKVAVIDLFPVIAMVIGFVLPPTLPDHALNVAFVAAVAVSVTVEFGA